MGAKFCLGLLILLSKSFYSGTLHPQVEALLDAERESSDNHKTSSTETDDEPPCEEEIAYNTDSCSDQEIEVQPEEKPSDEDNMATKGQFPTSNMKAESSSSKYSVSTRKSLAVSSKQYGCSPEASSSQCEQSIENASKTHYLY